MKTHLVALVLSVAGLPAFAFAEDKPEKTDAAPVAPAGDADAMFKQIEEMKPPTFNAEKRQDREYVQSYFKEMADTAKKRADLAKQFVEKYPDHPKKTDALYIQCEGLMRSGEPSDDLPKAVEAFVAAAPKDERGAMLLYSVSNMTDRGDKAKQAATMRKIIENYPNSEPAAMAKGQLRQTEGIGKPFELEFTDAISGKKISMKDLKGKVVVVDFWATWCGPCVAEMPHMKELYAEYKDKGVEFIGVSLDAPESEGGLDALKKFVKEKELPWPQYYQGKGWQSEFSRSWGINGIPSLFIVDAEGKLHSTQARGQLEKMIPELLAKANKAVSAR